MLKEWRYRARITIKENNDGFSPSVFMFVSDKKPSSGKQPKNHREVSDPITVLKMLNELLLKDCSLCIINLAKVVFGLLLRLKIRISSL